MFLMGAAGPRVLGDGQLGLLADQLPCSIKFVAASAARRPSWSLAKGYYLPRMPPPNVISLRDVRLVHEFWRRCTRESSSTKHVCKRRNPETGDIEKHPRHWLECTQTELYLLFKSEYPDVKIGRSTFEALKPWYVRAKTELHALSCCCSACANGYLAVKGVLAWRRGYQAALAAEAKRAARAAAAADGAAAAEGSQPGASLPPGHAAALQAAQRAAAAAQEAAATGGCKAQLQQLCQDVCCKEPTAACARQFPAAAGGCGQCGASRLQIFTPAELASSHTVTVFQWERVEVQQPDGAATQAGNASTQATGTATQAGATGAAAQPDSPTADAAAAGSSSKKPAKRVKLVRQELTAAGLQGLLLGQLGRLVWHLHVARHQALQWRRTLDEMQPGDCVISMDFSENAALVVGGEIQSNYWNRANATLFIAISWHWPLGASGPIKTNHIFISPDKNHSHRRVQGRGRGGGQAWRAGLEGRPGGHSRSLHVAALRLRCAYVAPKFVQHCLVAEGTVTPDGVSGQGILPWLRAQGFTPTFLNIWTDGCSEQFRCCDKHMWQSELGIPCCWHHWQAGHGKGEHDGVGTVVKAAVRLEAAVEDGWVIESAEQLFSYCQAMLSEAAAETSRAKAARRQLQGRRFVWIAADVVTHPAGQQQHVGAHGQRSMRCFASSGTQPGQLQMREMSCACPRCRKGEFAACEEPELPALKDGSVRLRGSRRAASQAPRQRQPTKRRRSDSWSSDSWSSSGEDEAEQPPEQQPTLSSADSELLAERIETQATQLQTLGCGDFVAVVAGDDEGEELWWIMRIDGPPRKVTACEAQQWNAQLGGGEGEAATYVEGQYIVSGSWLEFLDEAQDSFYVGGPAIAFSHLIIQPVDMISLPPAATGAPLFALPPFMDETLTAAAREVIAENRLVV